MVSFFFAGLGLQFAAMSLPEAAAAAGSSSGLLAASSGNHEVDDGDIGYKALPGSHAFPGMVIKFVHEDIWWGLALPWRAMYSSHSGVYKLSGVLHRQSDHLDYLFRWMHGRDPKGRHFQLQRDTPLEHGRDFAVSGFVSTEMLLPFFVWGCTLGPDSQAAKSRNKANYLRGLEVFASFINAFCARVPHAWTVNLGKWGVAQVMRGVVNVQEFLAAAAQDAGMTKFLMRWERHRVTRDLPWCSSTPPKVWLGEFIALLLLEWKLNEEVFWRGLLPALMQRLCKVLLHYGRYIASADFKALPAHQEKKRDSLLICQWLRELLTQSSRRDLPECLIIL